MESKKILYPKMEADIISNRVKEVVRSLPRELFVSEELRTEAYNDYPLSIDCGQTISQPSLVAYMTEKLDIKETDRVLEIGTGSGFQTAVLAKLAKKVYTKEIHAELSDKARKLLYDKLGFTVSEIEFDIGDGKMGWEHVPLWISPFDKIIVTATADKMPMLLFTDNLKVGGKMILPLKDEDNEEWLYLVEKEEIEENKLDYSKPIGVHDAYKAMQGKMKKTRLIPVRFVPLL